MAGVLVKKNGISIGFSCCGKSSQWNAVFASNFRSGRSPISLPVRPTHAYPGQ